MKQVHFKVMIITGAMLLFGLLTLAVQTQPVKAEAATLVGTILYNEKPVSQFTNRIALLSVVNETSNQFISANPTYNTATGEYSIPDLSPGEYGISVFIDSALPGDGRAGFAGDFNGWHSPIVVPEGQPIVNRNLTVVKTLHLTSPVDNDAIISTISQPWDTYPTEEMTFMWDALTEASSYDANIEEWDKSYTYVRLVASNTTSDVKWKVTLPMSVEDHFYMFNLYAYNINGVRVGWLMVTYSGGGAVGWDYRFRLAPEVIVESCNSAGDQTDSFDLGESVYVTGANFSASKTYNFSIVVDQEKWTNGMAIPERFPGTVPTVSSNNQGDIPPTAVWNDPQAIGKYDIVVDVNGNGQYDTGIDALDDRDIEVTAGFTIPELPSSLILPLLMIATLLTVTVRKRRHVRRKQARFYSFLPNQKADIQIDRSVARFVSVL